MPIETSRLAAPANPVVFARKAKEPEARWMKSVLKDYFPKESVDSKYFAIYKHPSPSLLFPLKLAIQFLDLVKDAFRIGMTASKTKESPVPFVTLLLNRPVSGPLKVVQQVPLPMQAKDVSIQKVNLNPVSTLFLAKFPVQWKPVKQ